MQILAMALMRMYRIKAASIKHYRKYIKVTKYNKLITQELKIIDAIILISNRSGALRRGC
jgi:hypothetical protein